MTAERRRLPFAVTLATGTSLANHTGAWRTERPVYRNLRAPCGDACPAEEDVQGWLYRAEEGEYEAAWRLLMAENPFPAIMGRVCYHPCETACNRGQVDEAVGINAVERFLGDRAIKQGWTMPVEAAPTGRRVLVVGAGPAGLAAAYHLRLLGHEVTVADAAERPGGMMRYGIPAYRLPRDVLDAEIDRVARMGVTFELGHPVTDLDAEREAYDAVFLAIGAQIGKRAYIPAGESPRLLDALAVLRSVAEDEPVRLGRRVVVYGGGNTAMDAARTARRLGATEAVVVYRRTRERMPAHESEVAEALDEGVQIRWLSTISAAAGEAIVLERMELDDTGFPRPTGQFETLAADSVVLAVGQDVDRTLIAALPETDGAVAVDEAFMTATPGVFAGGDMVPSERTCTVAVGHGKRAARRIHAWLTGIQPASGPKPPIADIERLNTWYYTEAPHQMRPRLETARRIGTFDEVVGGLDAETALFEARRCMSCGNCFECDNCYGMCPDNAIVKLGPGKGFAIDLDYCKGCGICAAECPAGAIAMIEEET
ncbi:NAD(P)-binding protein [Glycomyces harbinensis]|uniref:2-oxoacid:acceptor oxidoreductase, delta subunit, pyruvate/2-ketoisovalerate family n=1 Tax=Glycomyces harbinensis TaxID=58114 RepID=A0A1G6XLI6_9ACTN|nr:NAD(P)-binding protein [Glycomyces harbinensis]SDD79058.1 2-oxoacid:acceptor oxidoreductase, delta subunit, pyruvate/2-ketoisovalerate family [Glycomyces harbinensis]